MTSLHDRDVALKLPLANEIYRVVFRAYPISASAHAFEYPAPPSPYWKCGKCALPPWGLLIARLLGPRMYFLKGWEVWWFHYNCLVPYLLNKEYIWFSNNISNIRQSRACQALLQQTRSDFVRLSGCLPSRLLTPTESTQN